MPLPSFQDLAENVNNMAFGDDLLGVQFYLRTIDDPERSAREGRKCYRDREYVKIMVPGDRHNVIDRPVQTTGNQHTDDRLRFPRQYQRFKANAEAVQAMDGTPLTAWPGITGAMAEELAYINVRTVEQLADMADLHVGKIPLGFELKRRAAAFVAAQKDAAGINRLQAQLEEKDTRIYALEQAVKEQAVRIEALLSAGPRRGRPPKADD